MDKKDVNITIRTTSEIKNNLQRIAQNDDRTISYIVNKIIKDYLNNQNPKS